LSLLRLTWKGLWSRRAAVLLTLTAMAVSVALLVGVERLREGVRAGFATTVSGTDLIVGPRSGALQLALSALFRIGAAEHAMSWASFEALKRDPAVAWAIPLAFGDSHRDYPVVATNGDYFAHLRYGRGQELVFLAGGAFHEALDAVLGYEVAERLGYRLGDELELTHGIGESGHHHDEAQFTVIGILAPTGTPVDRSVHIPLAGMARIHAGWIGGLPIPGVRVIGTAEWPDQVNAVLLGLHQRTQVFAVQRRLQRQPGEPLSAVLPAVALDQLWGLVAPVERVLRLLALLVFLASALGMAAALLAGMESRRRELAVLRAVGAAPRHLLALVLLEGGLITLAGIAAGVALAGLLVFAAGGWVGGRFGIDLAAVGPGAGLSWLPLLFAVGLGAALVPALAAYRRSLADGLLVRE